MNNTQTIKVPKPVMAELQFEAESFECATAEEIGDAWRSFLDKVEAAQGDTLNLTPPEIKELRSTLLNTLDKLDPDSGLIESSSPEARKTLGILKRSINCFLPKLEG